MSPPESTLRRRRAVLQSLVATLPLGVAGCLGFGESTQGPAAEGTPSETSPCEATVSPPPAGNTSYPDQPNEITDSTAREFALDYERTFQRATHAGYQSLTVDSGPEISEIENGHVVRFVAWVRSESGGDGTETAVLGDEFYTVHYAVTEAGVRRAETSSTGPLEGGVDPTENGEQISCF